MSQFTIPYKDYKFPIIIAALSLLCSYALYPHFMSDDAYIHAGFINGLLSGDGFSFAGNITYGSTAPLWTLMVALLCKLTALESVLALRISSGLFGSITTVGFYFLSKKITNSIPVSIASTVVMAFNVYFLRWQLTGMESTAALAFIVAGIFLFISDNKNVSIVSGLLFGLGVLLRPEILLFLVVFFVFKICNDREKMNAFYFLIFGSLPILSWYLFAYWHFGTITPNSYLLKARESILSFEFKYLIRTIKLFLSGSLVEILFISFLAIFSIYYRRFFGLIKLQGYLIPQLFCCFVGFYLFYILKDVIIISRYSILVVPAIILTIGCLLTDMGQYKPSKFLISTVSIWCVASLLVNLAFTGLVVKPKSNQFSEGFQKTYYNMAILLSQEPKAQEMSVGLTDVGIVGTYSNMRVVDFAGLVDRDRFNYETIADYVGTKQPDYIILRGEVNIESVVPIRKKKKLIFSDTIPTLGINDNLKRTIQLWNIQWKN